MNDMQTIAQKLAEDAGQLKREFPGNETVGRLAARSDTLLRMLAEPGRVAKQGDEIARNKPEKIKHPDGRITKDGGNG